jgi:hypothetical protein
MAVKLKPGMNLKRTSVISEIKKINNYSTFEKDNAGRNGFEDIQKLNGDVLYITKDGWQKVSLMLAATKTL